MNPPSLFREPFSTAGETKKMDKIHNEDKVFLWERRNKIISALGNIGGLNRNMVGSSKKSVGASNCGTRRVIVRPVL